jgi:predicted dehydrogenase
MPPTRARVALIGYGSAGSLFHAPFIAATPRLRLTAVVTGNAERQARARRDYPDVAVLSTVENVWARAGDFELAVVATPNRTHVPLAIAALEAGLAVVVDKPFAATVEDARLVVKTARRRQLMCTVFQNRRWDGDFLTLRRLIDQGEVGRVTRFESRFERWRPEVPARWRERPEPEEAGGFLYDLGSHLIDQALILFGSVREVYAELDRRRPGAEVDDDTFVALTHDSGVRSHLWMSAVAAQAAPRFRVLGDRAAFTKYGEDAQEQALKAGLRPDRPDWVLRDSDPGVLGVGDDVRSVVSEPGDYGAFYDGVAVSLADGVPPPVAPEDAVDALAVIEAAQRSHAGRRVVEIER